MEHFISLYNGLMEHGTHIEQQIHMERDNAEADSSEDQLKRHLPLQDMVKRAPQDARRKGNELLRNLERVGVARGRVGVARGRVDGARWS